MAPNYIIFSVKKQIPQYSNVFTLPDSFVDLLNKYPLPAVY